MRFSAGMAVTAASAGLAVCAAPAGAADVSVVQESTAGKGPAPPPYVTFVARDGEANALTVTLDAGRYTFTDAGALVRAGRGCTQVDLRTASCSAEELRVTLGDGDDRLVAPYGRRITGDAGNDTIEAAGYIDAGEGDDVVRGGPGDDAIELGPGRDKGSGGAGDDRFGVYFSPPARLDTAGEPDEYDGGPGRDLLFYLGRRAAMRLDLTAGLSGEDGEDDRLVGMEGGGISFGRLLGDGNANALTATGRSIFAAGAGDDHVSAFSRGQDGIDAGEGDDLVELSSAWALERRLPRRDELRCGPGTDTVGLPAPNTIVPIDCEGATFWRESGPRVSLERGGPRADSPLAIVSGGECDNGARRCRVRATAHRVRRAEAMGIPDVGAVIASRSAVFVRRGARRLVLRPTRRGRAFLAGGGCRLANLTVTGLGHNHDQRVLFQVGSGCRPRAPLTP